MDPVLRPDHLHLHLSRALGNFLCSACKQRGHWIDHYYCGTCYKSFHKECAEINHPYHPRHPLKCVSPRDTFKSCSLCGKDFKDWSFHCYICDFCMDRDCARKSVPFVIDHPKSHEHTLTLMPRKISFTCDACGLVGGRCAYVCLQCDFMVHQSCIYLPRVIKTRLHPHRLSHTVSLPCEKLKYCGFCRKKVDRRYGGYSCNKGCPYVVHSKCATKDGVWDKRELEGIPEDADEFEDLEPFKKIGDKVIRYFAHDRDEHDLSLIEGSSVCSESKSCQACTDAISSEPFYSCIQCDFILHEKCASFPPKILHALHTHPLTLSPGDRSIAGDVNLRGVFRCDGCGRFCNGFKYTCPKGTCSIMLDVRCALISDPVSHESHDMHLLFFMDDKRMERGRTCHGCGKGHRFMLNCSECDDFSLDLRCATLPRMITHKYDEHPLVLRYGEDASEPYWCEICEEEMDPKKWFYVCDCCGFIAHVDCVFDSFSCLRPGKSFRFMPWSRKCSMVLNNRASRPLCSRCGNHCRQTLVAKAGDEYYCSVWCACRC